jgi:hypothetical protein
MKKLSMFALPAVAAALALGMTCAVAKAAVPTFSFSNTAPVTFTLTGGVYTFSAVPVDVTDTTLTLGPTGTLTGAGTASDYDVTLLDGSKTYDVITDGTYAYVGSPFYAISASDAGGAFTATIGKSKDQLSGTFVPAATPESGTAVALGVLLLMGGLAAVYKRPASLDPV